MEGRRGLKELRKLIEELEGLWSRAGGADGAE